MAAKNRALYIDLLKGLALLVMIEVHVFNSFIIPEVKKEWWVVYLHFINGLVAPSFTFTSGLVFILSLQKGVDKLRSFGSDFWKKMSRIGLIFIAGYSLHLPFFSLTDILNNPSQENLENLFAVDILQIIATGLLLLLLLKIFIKSEKAFYNTLTGLILFILLAGPFAWKYDFTTYIPLPIANYFNMLHRSLFPIFPWWAFILCGALTAKYYIAAKQQNQEPGFINKMLLIGLSFFIIGFIVYNILLPERTASLKPNPFFFLQRLGVVLFLLAICWHFISKKENPKSILLDVSRESLLVYWLHLQLISGTFIWGDSLYSLYNGRLNIFEVIVLTVVLIVIMMIAAKGWGILKMKYPVYTKRFAVAWITLAVVLFLLL
jgi:uncharacterized membrane protein